jgi:hypothetical protein
VPLHKNILKTISYGLCGVARYGKIVGLERQATDLYEYLIEVIMFFMSPNGDKGDTT